MEYRNQGYEACNEVKNLLRVGKEASNAYSFVRIDSSSENLRARRRVVHDRRLLLGGFCNLVLASSCVQGPV